MPVAFSTVPDTLEQPTTPVPTATSQPGTVKFSTPLKDVKAVTSAPSSSPTPASPVSAPTSSGRVTFSSTNGQQTSPERNPLLDPAFYKQQAINNILGPVGLLPFVGNVDRKLLSLATDMTLPIPDFFGPKTALTQRLFPGSNDEPTPMANMVDALFKVAPLGLTLVGARPIKATVEALPVLKAMAAAKSGAQAAKLAQYAIEGAAGGALWGGTQAAVDQTSISEGAVSGGVMGAAAGSLIGHFSPALDKTVTAYKNVRGGMPVPDIFEIDKGIPAPDLTAREGNAGALAAREAWGRTNAAGKIEAQVPSIIWQRAKEDAARAAARAREGKPDALRYDGELLSRLMTIQERSPYSNKYAKAFDDIRSAWGQWVTRAAIAFNRDKQAFGEYGPQIGGLLARKDDLFQTLHGRLSSEINLILKGMSQKDRLTMETFLSGKGGSLEPDVMAKAMRVRELTDGMFSQLRQAGVQELVDPSHPAARSDLLKSEQGVVSGPSFGEPTSTAGPATYAQPEQPQGAISIPIQRRTNYVPQYRDTKAIARIAKPGAAQDAFLQKLVDSGQADNRNEAQALLKAVLEREAIRSPLAIRAGFQHQQDLSIDLPYEKDPAVWLRRWGHDVSARLADALTYGPGDEKAIEIFKQMAKNGYDAKRAQDLWRISINRPTAEQRRGATLAYLARNVVALKLLGPKLAPLQMLQNSNTAAAIGWKGLLEGIVGSLKHQELRDMATYTGATLPSHAMFSEQEPLGQAAQWYMNNVTQFQHSDAAVRIIANTGGATMAREWAQRYFQLASEEAKAGSPSLVQKGFFGNVKRGAGVRNRADEMMILKDRLERMAGIPTDYVMKNNGDLPDAAMLHAGLRISNNTQFSNSVLNMPEMWRTPAGRYTFMLKTFAKQQSGFISGMVDRAVKHGDTGPLARYLLTYPPLYAAVLPILDLFSNRQLRAEADAEAVDRFSTMLKNAATTGMFGGVGDFLNQAAGSDAGKLMSYIAGPAVSELLGTGYDIGKGLGGDWGPAGVRGLSFLPAAPVWLPYAKRHILNGETDQ